MAGHELTHGFDDQGKQRVTIPVVTDYTSKSTSCEGHQYNKDGILTQWWTNASMEAFNERKQCFVRQYSSYSLQGHQVMNYSLVKHQNYTGVVH